MRKFKIGQLVNYLGHEHASGVYQITQLLPPEGEAFQYRGFVQALDFDAVEAFIPNLKPCAPAELFLAKPPKGSRAIASRTSMNLTNA